MSSFPMMSTVHHCRNHRQSVESVRSDENLKLQQPPLLITPKVNGTTLRSQNSNGSQTMLPQCTVVNATVTAPVSNLTVIADKPIWRPVVGIFWKDNLIKNIPIIFPNQN